MAFTENVVMSYSHHETIYVKTGQEVNVRISSTSFNSLNREEAPCDEEGNSKYNEVRYLLTLKMNEGA